MTMHRDQRQLRTTRPTLENLDSRLAPTATAAATLAAELRVESSPGRSVGSLARDRHTRKSGTEIPYPTYRSHRGPHGRAGGAARANRCGARDGCGNRFCPTCATSRSDGPSLSHSPGYPCRRSNRARAAAPPDRPVATHNIRVGPDCSPVRCRRPIPQLGHRRHGISSRNQSSGQRVASPRRHLRRL